MRGVFRSFNEQCLKEGLFGGKTVAIDGTKIKAWNSMDRSYTKEKIEAMKKRMGKLKEIKRIMDQDGRSEISLTDPEARQMKTRHGIDVCYNGQISVDDRNHLIVEYDLTSDPTDCASMVPMSEKSKEFLQSEDMESLSDRDTSPWRTSSPLPTRR